MLIYASSTHVIPPGPCESQPGPTLDRWFSSPSTFLSRRNHPNMWMNLIYVHVIIYDQPSICS